MTDFKDEGTLTTMIHDCDDAIRRQGGRARVTFRVPGLWGTATHKRLFPRGPRGQIMAQTNDRTKLIVMFVAAEVKTKLEEIKNGIITTANRN